MPASARWGGGVMVRLPLPDADRDALLTTMQSKGITHLWVEAGGNTAQLTPLIERGKSYGVAVGAVVSLMQAEPSPAKTKVPSSTDTNILGETGAGWSKAVVEIADLAVGLPGSRVLPGENDPPTRKGDWLLPQDAHTLPLLRERIEAVAATQGLATVVLMDTAAPGYQALVTPRFDRSETSADFGYTLDNRITFLRTTGYDPVDTIRGEDSRIGDAVLPFFTVPGKFATGTVYRNTESKTVLDKWAALRYKQQGELLGRLFTSLRANHPALPLYLNHTDDAPGQSGFVLWERADTAPDPPTGPVAANNGRKSPAVIVPILASPAALQAISTYQTDTTPPGSPQRLAQLIRSYFTLGNRGKPAVWDGFVLDMREMPIKTALPLLSGGLADPAKAIKP